jgi:hypothetical protein
VSLFELPAVYRQIVAAANHAVGCYAIAVHRQLFDELRNDLFLHGVRHPDFHVTPAGEVRIAGMPVVTFPLVGTPANSSVVSAVRSQIVALNLYNQTPRIRLEPGKSHYRPPAIAKKKKPSPKPPTKPTVQIAAAPTRRRRLLD